MEKVTNMYKLHTGDKVLLLIGHWKMTFDKGVEIAKHLVYNVLY